MSSRGGKKDVLDKEKVRIESLKLVNGFGFGVKVGSQVKKGVVRGV